MSKWNETIQSLAAEQTVTPTPPDPRSPFNEAWRAFLAEHPNVATLPAEQRAMLRRGFVYGWRAREVA